MIKINNKNMHEVLKEALNLERAAYTRDSSLGPIIKEVLAQQNVDNILDIIIKNNINVEVGEFRAIADEFGDNFYNNENFVEGKEIDFDVTYRCKVFEDYLRLKKSDLVLADEGIVDVSSTGIRRMSTGNPRFEFVDYGADISRIPQDCDVWRKASEVVNKLLRYHNSESVITSVYSLKDVYNGVDTSYYITFTSESGSWEIVINYCIVNDITAIHNGKIEYIFPLNMYMPHDVNSVSYAKEKIPNFKADINACLEEMNESLERDEIFTCIRKTFSDKELSSDDCLEIFENQCSRWGNKEEFLEYMAQDGEEVSWDMFTNVTHKLSNGLWLAIL